MIDRRTLVLSAAALPLAGCMTRAGGRETLSVATFNIWHDAGDWRARLPLIVGALAKSDCDVIALQEVLEDAGKGLPNQAETIAAMLSGYTVRFASTNPPGATRRYGNALLTRVPIVETAERKLEPLSDYRTALRIRLGGRIASLDIVCTHLAHEAHAGPVRARQLQDLMAWLPQDGVPTVIMGDFNAPLTDAGLRPLDPRFTSAALPPSVTTTLNTSRGHEPRIIDHIFAQRDALVIGQAERFGDIPTANEYPSDHFGVRAVLKRPH